MEATEGMMIRLIKTEHQSSDYYLHYDNYELMLFAYGLGKHEYTLRLRGGGDTDKRIHEIPFLNDIKFIWNGRPCIDFIDKIMYPLNNGLASVTLGKSSLYNTAMETDPAGRLGVPLLLAATPAEVAEHAARVDRLFSCILNYTDRNSAIYKTFMREFNRDGIAVYKCILAYGVIPTPIRIMEARSDAWKQMSMKALKIPYSIDGFLQMG